MFEDITFEMPNAQSQNIYAKSKTRNVTNNKKSVHRSRLLVWIAVIILAVLAYQYFTSDKLSGTTWKYTYDAGSYTTWSFSKGTMTVREMNIITGQQESHTVSYKVDGNKLIVTQDGQTETIEFSISGKTMTLKKDGVVFATLDKM